MELEFSGKDIIMKGKELNSLDKKVIKLVKLIDFEYVIISGYIAILFGRSRATEDVDMFIRADKEEFYAFYNLLSKNNFYIINAENKEEGYEFLHEGIALRIAENGEFMPNFELKLPKREIDRITMRDKIKVKLDNYELNISEIELQIAFKLFLGSEKDYLDSKHLYNTFENYLDKKKLYNYIKLLGVNISVAERILKIKIP